MPRDFFDDEKGGIHYEGNVLLWLAGNVLCLEAVEVVRAWKKGVWECGGNSRVGKLLETSHDEA